MILSSTIRTISRIKTRKMIQPVVEAPHRNSTLVESHMARLHLMDLHHLITMQVTSMVDQRRHIMEVAISAGHHHRLTITICTLLDHEALAHPQACIHTSEAAHIVAITANANTIIQATQHTLVMNQVRHIHLTTITTSNIITVELIVLLGQ